MKLFFVGLTHLTSCSRYKLRSNNTKCQLTDWLGISVCQKCVNFGQQQKVLSTHSAKWKRKIRNFLICKDPQFVSCRRDDSSNSNHRIRRNRNQVKSDDSFVQCEIRFECRRCIREDCDTFCIRRLLWPLQFQMTRMTQRDCQSSFHSLLFTLTHAHRLNKWNSSQYSSGVLSPFFVVLLSGHLSDAVNEDDDDVDKKRPESCCLMKMRLWRVNQKFFQITNGAATENVKQRNFKLHSLAVTLDGDRMMYGVYARRQRQNVSLNVGTQFCIDVR